ncbi:2-keto-4-pentenoate hydratase [Seonamhaeicola maritimus]|uniref:2-keto-4-pentenoate hydratase n=1 Tax=Seonamhaeicola maritimus TaxID=2591822 RepID=A0A5C7GDP4_9FLAO|nr:fumarylacetoacetate hydrolase family protein [Seonamhaeicola maritimus]TXG34688.1 2-keto-4-pentenoate hydratase [Seonamhaeicola maritimus]
MDNNKIKEMANRLYEASQTRSYCSPVREVIGIEDIEAAYATQDINTERRHKAGARIVGSKIGLTSVVVQKQLGVDQPDFGVLFDDMELENGSEVDYNLLMQPKAEAEIAFVLKEDLSNSQIGAADVISAIDYALVSIEIVGSRIANWDIKITDTIADNASASHFVLGHKPVKLENLDLTGCSMEMFVNGEKVSEGTGAACMGSPINATLWLAKIMAKLGRPLKAGDVILSGALGPMATISPGDEVVTTISGLGSVSIKFSDR